jgi:hypothetical protein
MLLGKKPEFLFDALRGKKGRKPETLPARDHM